MQAITADAVLLKFEKAKVALKDSLKQVDDIVPRSIGCQVIEKYGYTVCFSSLKVA